MSLMDEIKDQITDEEKAHEMYLSMANEADNAGMHQTARNLRSIAADEDRHHTILQQMFMHPELGPEGRTWLEELAWREKSGFGELHRPFPETYSDWVNLAADIKERDPSLTPMVNGYMGIIAEITPGDVDDAKRWLVNKAGELGIT